MRQKCYNCFRPESSCICSHATKITSKAKFLILMHPMERQKVKNNTGFISHYSLPNSELIEGIDFSQNERLNNYLNNDEYNVFMLYPSSDARPIKEHKQLIANKKNLFILIDATWPCAKKIIRLSPNLKECTPITFEKMHLSGYKVKEQPRDGYISTMETIQVLLTELNNEGLESIEKDCLEKFIEPFKEINRYQLACLNDPNKPTYDARSKRNKA